MGKKKNQKKKAAKKEAEHRRHDDVTIDDNEDDNDSVRSDAATLPSSDDTIAAATANDFDASVEGGSIRDDESASGRAGGSRKRATWMDLMKWWEGELGPMVRILNDMILDMKRTGTEGFTNVMEILASEDEMSTATLREAMEQHARKCGVRCAPSALPVQLQEEDFESAPIPSVAELRDRLEKWRLHQESLLSTDVFNNLNIRRWEYQDDNNGPLGRIRSTREELSRQLLMLACADAKQHGDSKKMNGAAATGATSAPATSTNRNAPEYIKVHLFTSDGGSVQVSLRRTTKMGKLKEKHCEKLGKAVRAFVYRYKGKFVRDSDTAEELGMKDNDFINVMENPARRGGAH